MTKRLAIVLTEGFADWECGLLMATARGEYQAETVVLTPGGADVTSLGGLAVASAGWAEDARPEDFDVLVLCGGTIWQSAAPPDLSAPVGRFVDAGKPVAAICDATLEFARLGLLDARAHTGNYPGQLGKLVPAYRGAAHYRDQPRAVNDRGVISDPLSPSSIVIHRHLPPPPSSSSGLTRGSMHHARPEFGVWILGSSPRMTEERWVPRQDGKEWRKGHRVMLASARRTLKLHQALKPHPPLTGPGSPSDRLRSPRGPPSAAAPCSSARRPSSRRRCRIPG